MENNALKPVVLFVCVENSCRSQMAQGLANHFGQDVLVAYSAGSKPSGIVNPQAVLVMKEIGIDISRNQSKGFDQLPKIDFHPSSSETPGYARGGRRRIGSPTTPDSARRELATDEPGGAKGESPLAKTGHSKVPRALPVGLHLAITLGCGDQCPFVPAERHVAWDIEDPKGKDIEFFRRVRDQISGLVKELVEKLREQNFTRTQKKEG